MLGRSIGFFHLLLKEGEERKNEERSECIFYAVLNSMTCLLLKSSTFFGMAVKTFFVVLTFGSAALEAQGQGLRGDVERQSGG